jgi:uncharacterized membrane protein
MPKPTGGIMAFCSKCGSVVSEGSTFCSVCGSPASAAGAPATPPPPPTPPAPVGAASIGLSSNVAAALSYFFITGIIFLLMDQFKQDKFVRFHSFQAIAFGIVAFVLQIVWHMIVSFGLFALGFFAVSFGLIGFLIWLAIFAYWLFLMYKAYNNETYKIPVIGDWASNQAAK